MNKKTLNAVLSQFNMGTLEYNREDYISVTILDREDNTYSFQLVFGYKNKKAIKCKPLIIKDFAVSEQIRKVLRWGRATEENEKDEFLSLLLSDATKAGFHPDPEPTLTHQGF